MSEKFYFIIKDKLTLEVTDFRVYHHNSREELLDLADKFNANPNNKTIYEPVFGDAFVSFINLAGKWKGNKALDDIWESLRDVEDTLNSICVEVASILKGLD